MKRAKNLTMAVLVTALSTGMVVAQDLSEVFESDNGRTNVRLEESSYAKYKLIYPVRNAGIVYVKIYDQQGQQVFSDRIRNKNGFMKPYDFSNMPDGNYKFMIKSDGGKIITDVVHKLHEDDLNIALGDTGEKDAYRLVVTGVKKDPVYVNIYDYKDQLVFEDIVKVGKNFSRVYSFPENAKDLTFVVTQNDYSIAKRAK
jgi:hypothetical protein